ncbi:MAG: phosphoglycolate phosphatase [Kiloniellaceae bacterium]
MNTWLPRHAPVLVCDLDGTLIDSVPDLAAAANALLAEQHRPALATEAIKAMVGDGVAKLVERAFAATGAPPAPARLDVYVARYLAIYEPRSTDRTRPYPDTLETLAGLKAAGWRLAVCTNKPERASHRVLAALGMADLFEAVAGGDTFPVKKPAPEHILGLLARMGGSPAHAAMVGDSPNDVRAARAAGLPVVAVAHGYGPVPARELGADRLIESLAELPAALAALGLGAPARLA